MNAEYERTTIHPGPDGAARAHEARRGSALLIVIGTLALIAVFAAVYISIGRTDRRSANALRSRIEQRETSRDFSEYIAGIIGRDRLDAYVQYDANGLEFGRREVTDAPYTDWTRRSEVTPGNEHFLFTPAGGPYQTEGLTPTTDFRVASDPWLASTTPTYLGDPGTPSTGLNLRPFSAFAAFDPNYPNAFNYLDNRDWLQISNFAPDGRPVNLFNLRPTQPDGNFSGLNGAGSAVGGFEAEPGFGTSPRADARPIRRMSNFLSLLNQSVPGDPESLIRAFDPVAAGGVWVPGYNDPQPVGITGTDLYNTPAVWTMYQRFMFMPINQPFITLNRNDQVSTWADPDYPPYQYADADGDGFADSRWFELAAARDANEGSNNQAREDIQRLYQPGDYRYFIAARAVDLSSMVNVNTATDQLVPPTPEFPMGATPADVDLRRLLTMQDPAGDYVSVLRPGGAIPLSYQALHRPYIWQQDYQIPRQWDAPGRPVEFDRHVFDYNFYQHSTEGSAYDLRDLEDDAPSMLIGRYAYDALRRGLLQGGSLTEDYRGNYPGESPDPDAVPLFQFERDPTDFGANPMAITAEQRYLQYMNVGRLDPTTQGLAWAREITFGSGLYGLGDLTELLTFHGLNDPESTSRLEQVTFGRFESRTSDELLTMRMGPLMNNRPLELDRFQHGLALADMGIDPRTPATDDASLREINGRIALNSMAHMALTPRNKLTTISGHTPLSPDERLASASEPAAMTDQTAAPDLKEALSDANLLFSIYGGALARELDSDNLDWEQDPADFDINPTSTLFYGHKGPELSLRAAAHAAVNMKDLADGDQDPTIATLLLRSDTTPNDLRDYASDLTEDDVNPTGDAEYQLYPGIASGNFFDRMRNWAGNDINSGLTEKRQAVNVYGMEATPVITEVSMLYAFTDAPGDTADVSPDNPYVLNLNGQRRVIYPPNSIAVTINGEVAIANRDYLIQVLAVQLHNPYDREISLGGTDDNGNRIASGAPLTRKRQLDASGEVNENVIDTSANYQFDYYIEYAGRFFKVARYLEWYPTENNAENYYSFDDPNTTVAYQGVPNPATAFDPALGGQMPPGTGAYPDFIARNVVLGPGETRVFYAIADKRFDDASGPDDRWTTYLRDWGDLPQRFEQANIDPDVNDLDGDNLIDGPGDTRGWTGPAEQWVGHQLQVIDDTGTDPEPVMMMTFDPEEGEFVDETMFEALHTPSNALGYDSSRVDATEVRLWKKIVTLGEETADPDIPGATQRNLIENDMLVDRMELETNLDPQISGDHPISGTYSYPEDFPIPGTELANLGARNDNRGITVSDWITHRRMDSEDQLKPSPGQVTPWMLRARNNPSSTRVKHEGYLTGDVSGDDVFSSGAGDPTEPAVERGDYEVHATLRGFWDLSRSTGANAIVQTLALAPHLKSDVTDTGYTDSDGANDSAGKFAPQPALISVSTMANLDPRNGMAVPEILVGGANIFEAPRLADLLLAWGIGPTYAPDPNRPASTGTGVYEPEEWMTASEAMAIALGIDNPVPSGPDFDDADAIWVDAYDVAADDNLLDLGRLAIDRFVPFLNTGAPENPIEFDPFVDIRRGAGVPLALGVLDRVRAIEPLAQLSDPINPAGGQFLEMELTRPTYGTININTAPVEVLRLLPGLTPSRAQYFDSAGYQDEWIGSQYDDLELPDLTSATSLAGLIENPDVAAGIIAYRDRMLGIPNTGARPERAGSGWYDESPMNLAPSVPNLDYVQQNMIGELTAEPMSLGPDPWDRATFTGIEGLRTTPGFGSLGELLAVRFDPALVTDTYRWPILSTMSIQQLGFDEKAQGIADTTEGKTTILSQIFGNDVVGETVDGYDERIAMANAVANTISVRSDFYAVWFVVHGYRESDVSNLRPQDPLVPSV
ncbi:MAG: hypothetical protein WD114_07125, partial [Phycisphaerales bacterium]